MIPLCRPIFDKCFSTCSIPAASNVCLLHCAHAKMTLLPQSKGNGTPCCKLWESYLRGVTYYSLSLYNLPWGSCKWQRTWYVLVGFCQLDKWGSPGRSIWRIFIIISYSSRWRIPSTRPASGHVWATLSWLMIDLGGLSQWAVPDLGRWFWAVREGKLRTGDKPVSLHGLLPLGSCLESLLWLSLMVGWNLLHK